MEDSIGHNLIRPNELCLPIHGVSKEKSEENQKKNQRKIKGKNSRSQIQHILGASVYSESRVRVHRIKKHFSERSSFRFTFST